MCKLQEDWLKKNKPKKCPDVDNFKYENKRTSRVKMMRSTNKRRS